MTLSDLSKSNAKKIAEFFKENFSDGWTENMLVSAFNTDRFHAICIKEEEEIIGIVTFSYAGDTSDIEDIVIKKEERRKGYGNKLLSAAICRIIADGMKRVMLEVREGNTFAIALYTKLGFTPLSVRKKYYSDGENALVMIREF